MSKEDFEYWLEDQIQRLNAELEQYEWFSTLSDEGYRRKQIELEVLSVCKRMLSS